MANCGTGASCPDNLNIPSNFLSAVTGSTSKRYGLKGYVITDGSWTIADTNDLTLWKKGFDDGFIQCGPCGTIDLGTPNSNTDKDICGNITIDETIYTPTFTGKQVDKENLTHVAYYDHFRSIAPCVTIIYFDCDGNPILHPDHRRYLAGQITTAPGTNPGLSFSLSQNPHPVSGNNNREVWTMQFNHTFDGDVIIGQSLLPGLYDTLCS